jgi:hypothetical protein
MAFFVVVDTTSLTKSTQNASLKCSTKTSAGVRT